LIGLFYNRTPKADRLVVQPVISPDQRERVLTALREQQLYKDP